MRQVITSAFLLLFAAQAQGAAPKNTVAVLSVNSGAYLEAFSAFQAAYGGEVSHYDLSTQKPELGKDVKLLVTFGGKAANYDYAVDTNIVYCLAPGVFAMPPRPGLKAVKISLIPDFRVTFSKLKKIQPGLKRLSILWMLPDANPYSRTVRAEGSRQGIQVTTVRLNGPESLPGALRRALTEADALWLAPDPLIVTRRNLLILREFSWENKMPFYGSTKSMTREGAVASFGISFAEMGKAAALAAGALDSGGSLPETVFPEKTETTLNAAAAAKLGLEFPRSILEEAGYLFP